MITIRFIMSPVKLIGFPACSLSSAHLRIFAEMIVLRYSLNSRQYMSDREAKASALGPVFQVQWLSFPSN